MFEMETLGAGAAVAAAEGQLAFRTARADLERIVDDPGGATAGQPDRVRRRRADPAHRVHRQGDRPAGRRPAHARRAGDAAARRARDHGEHRRLDAAPGRPSTRRSGERLHEEAVAVYGDRPPAYEDLHRLRYTHMVLQEAMRLYPPVWILPRRAQARRRGRRVPRAGRRGGADLPVHRCTGTRGTGRSRTVSTRSGSTRTRRRTGRGTRTSRSAPGPRFCVGNHLGMMEAAFIIAMLMRDLRLSTWTAMRWWPEPMLSLRVRGGLPMTVHQA